MVMHKINAYALHLLAVVGVDKQILLYTCIYVESHFYTFFDVLALLLTD